MIKPFYVMSETMMNLLNKIKSISPDIIVNCIGILIKGANENPENAIYINSYMPHMLMKLSDEIEQKINPYINRLCFFRRENYSIQRVRFQRWKRYLC